MAKIVFIAEALCSDMPNGIKTYTDELIRSILSFDNNKYFLIVSRLIKDLDIEQIILPFPKGPFSIVRRNLYQLPQFLKKLNPDIVHEFSHFGPFLYPSKFKKIINVYDLIPLLLPKTRPDSAITYLRNRYGLSLLLRKTDRIIAISNNTKKDITNYFDIPSDKITVVYGAANSIFGRFDSDTISIFRKKSNIDFPFILNVGTIEPRKNQEFLIDVFNKLKKKYRIPHRLIIIGNRDEPHKDIFCLLQKLSFNKEIEILGNVNNEDLAGYYNSADLFVYPSLYEGFGLPLLEAMRCGCPVIASNNSSIGEICSNSAVLLKLDNKDRWVDEIYGILNNVMTRKTLIENGSERAANFNWIKSASIVLELYDRVLRS